MRYIDKFSVLQAFTYISHRQTTTFGNSEKGIIWHSQSTGNQYSYNNQTVTPSTGKEKDSETGYYNFGARYYDPVLSGLFLSVDPMSDKYPSLSPYNYCAWNPVKLVDPDGEEMDDYRLDVKTGELRFYHQTGDSRDCIQAGYYSGNGWVNTDVSFNCAKGILYPDNSVDNSTKHLFANESEGLSLMKNVSFACHKEIAAYSFIEGFEVSFEIFPWNENDALNSKFLVPEKAKSETIIYDIHTHCGTENYMNDGSGTLIASDMDKKNVATNGDWNHYILSIKHGLGQFDKEKNVNIDKDNLSVSLRKYFRGNPIK